MYAKSKLFVVNPPKSHAEVTDKLDMRSQHSKVKSEVPNPKKESVGFFGDLLQSNLALQTMVTDKIGTVQELQQKIKDAQAEDKKTREDSRSKRNELNIWKALLEAGDAVRRADPAGGLLAAAAAGASAGGKSFVEGRMKLAKEAEGDGQKAINAIQTEIKIQQADSALIMSAGQVKAQQITAMANWIKNNGLKKMNTKVMAGLIKNAKERAAVHPKDSQAARDAYSYTLRMSILAYEKTGGNLSTAIRAGLHVPVSQVNPTQSKLAATVGEESRRRKGQALRN